MRLTSETSVLAGEYALGLLPPDESRAFEARLAAEPELRDEVGTWQTAFGDLFDVEEERPPPQVRARLRERFGPVDPPPAQGGMPGAGILAGKAAVILAIVALIWMLA